jgi:hypothetical protein
MNRKLLFDSEKIKSPLMGIKKEAGTSSGLFFNYLLKPYGWIDPMKLKMLLSTIP